MGSEKSKIEKDINRAIFKIQFELELFFYQKDSESSFYPPNNCIKQLYSSAFKIFLVHPSGIRPPADPKGPPPLVLFKKSIFGQPTQKFF